MSRCSVCQKLSETLDDLKPYPVDICNPTEYSHYSTVDEYTKMCCKCWNNMYEQDQYLYKELNVSIPVISWENPIINKKEKTVVVKKDVKIENNDEELFNGLFQKKSKKSLATLLDMNEEIKIYEEKQKEFDARIEQENKDRDNKYNMEAKERKKNNKENKQKELDETETAKMAHPDAKQFIKCYNCCIFKAFPHDFKSKKTNKLYSTKKDTCTECMEQVQQEKNDYKKSVTVTCKCGCKYSRFSFEAQIKHERTSRHQKNMLRNIPLKSDNNKYTVLQLHQICMSNNIDRSSYMSKAEMIAKLNSIDNVSIPSFKK